MQKWVKIFSSGEIPSGSAVILTYRINGSLTNGINGQRFTHTDAVRALNDNNVVEYLTEAD